MLRSLVGSEMCIRDRSTQSTGGVVGVFMAKPNISNPGLYSGQKVSDLRHGFGKYEYPGGIYTYEGEWHEGQKHGRGLLRFADKGLWADCGSEYEGEFVNGEMTGFGHRRWKDGSSYEGDFVEGERHGVGVYTFADGTTYEGQFCANQFHGEGKWVEADGTTYEGTFAKHRRTGKGIETSWDGSSFDGDWEDGRRGGNGTWTSAAGASYVGEWKTGVRHGDGVFAMDGYRYEGTWENGAPTIPAGKIILKTARSDTDDFEPSELDFMSPVPPERLSVDTVAWRPDAEQLQGWVPLDHLVFYFKKPPVSELPPVELPQDTEVDLNIDYSKPSATPPKPIERKGIEAGRVLKLKLHRWGLPKVVEGAEEGEPGIQSPRTLARLVVKDCLLYTSPSPRDS
eukprot:TRINITY_DN28768_c0_g2_i2.p1 TRINITY_DN28768_c0_g2~~TRINITY_DN28768_c0_g2_i2.p1  ORF type:complete len:397 (+),score=84.45 TRINITY_DN28768_c0_g2_i2:115-1305(+)